MKPDWLALLAPLPPSAVVERTPVVSPELAAQGGVDAIAGWESLRVHLSVPDIGLRHILVTLDADATLLSASDHVMIHHHLQKEGTALTVYDHESIGGRFEPEGAFGGTRWVSRSEQQGDSEEATVVESTPSTPSPADVEALRTIVAEVVRRAPGRTA